MKRADFLRSACAVMAATVLGAPALASDYPNRSIELLVPFAVGGGTDAVARAFAEAAHKQLPTAMVVTNKPGAAGAIGHTEGARAAPDGYKLTMVTPEINLALLQGIGKTKYQDFTFVARMNVDPIVLIVPADSPFQTLEEVLEKAKAEPEQLPLANSGQGATYHLAAIALEDVTGVKFNNIPYVGAGPAMTAILGHQVAGGFATTGEAGTFVKAGKFRLLGVMANERLKDFPDVPTFKERGVDLELGTWRALAVPAGTPADVVATLRDVVRKVNDDPKYRDFFERQYLGIVYEDGEQFTPVLAREYDFYNDIVTRLGLK